MEHSVFINKLEYPGDAYRDVRAARKTSPLINAFMKKHSDGYRGETERFRRMLTDILLEKPRDIQRDLFFDGSADGVLRRRVH